MTIDLPTTDSSAEDYESAGLSASDGLLSVSQGYRLLAPTLHWVRKQMQGHTILPNALQPLANAMVWGYRGAECLEAAKLLQQSPGWLAYQPLIEKGYAAFKEQTSNQLVWLGWNYWDPSRPLKKQRQIQVVLSPTEDLRQFVLSGTSIPGVAPHHDANHFRMRGEKLRTQRFNSGRSEWPLTDEDLKIRDYAEGLWDEFVNGVEYFRHNRHWATIGDVLLDNFNHSEDKVRMKSISPVVFLKVGNQEQGERVTAEHSKRGIPCVYVTTSELAAFSRWTEKLVPGDHSHDCPSSTSAAIDRCAEVFRDYPKRVPPEVRDVVRRLTRNVEVSSQAEAYVTTQYVMYFVNAMRTQAVYGLPVAFGQYFGVMIMGMHRPLGIDQLFVWHAIATNLFGGLLVDRLAGIHRENELRRHGDDERQLLSHSMPKFVFKPLEYTATRLLAKATASERLDVEDVRGLARTSQLLVSRGQQVLSDFSHTWFEYDQSELKMRQGSCDLAKLCKLLEQDFVQHCAFFVSGYVDRLYRRDAVRQTLRAELTGDGRESAVTLSVEAPSTCTIVGDRGQILSHLWNLIDNGFHCCDWTRISQSDESRLGEVLKFEIRVIRVDETSERYVELRVFNSGSVLATDREKCLNLMFSSNPETEDFDQASASVKSWASLDCAAEGLQPENEGIGLAKFSAYLRRLWLHYDHTPEPIARVESLPSSGVEFSFRFPRPPQ